MTCETFIALNSRLSLLDMTRAERSACSRHLEDGCESCWLWLEQRPQDSKLDWHKVRDLILADLSDPEGF